MIPDPMNAVPISDDEFLFGSGRGIHSNRLKPSLIVFPHEKDHLGEDPSNKLPFRFYIPEVWRAAREFVSNADEVWIIGYSAPEPDWSPLESLLNATAETCRVIVQNPAAETIAGRLRVRLPRLAERITAHIATFDT